MPRDRRDAPPQAPPGAWTIDLVIITAVDDRLAVLAGPSAEARGRSSASLPWMVVPAAMPLRDAARRLSRRVLSGAPAWLEQLGAFADGTAHPSGLPLSVAFVAVVPALAAARAVPPPVWLDASARTSLSERHRDMVVAALGAIRARMDQVPIAFHLLPRRFTLGELQGVYELLLERRLHKASFRRALHAAWLVEPTDAWRQQGRGRPARLFRFAPRRRRSGRRSVRFDLL